MKSIKLIDLSLRNFKGIKHFELNADGTDIKVFGDNATGKTTVFDAFVWLLFGKDSQNKTDFEIKTLVNGEPIHHLEHEVTATLLVDGKELTLKKVFKEKWTRKRGSATENFSGHTTDFFIDGVPSKKKEYEETISSIVDEEIFKLLTNPAHFNEQLKWQDRRKMLLEIAGDVTDEDVISTNDSLKKLANYLGNRTIDDHKKVIMAKRKEINEELERIPIRIDEINRNLPDVDDLDKQSLKAKIEIINADIDEKQTLINNIRNGNAIVKKQKEIQEVEIELLKIKQQHDAGSKNEFYKLKARIQEEESNISIINSNIENIKNKKRYNDENIKNIESNLVSLRREWHEVNKMEFEHNDQCECPTCGQSLPEEQVSAAREKALEQFNLTKSKRLEEINEKGKRGAEQKNKIVQDNEQLEKEYEKLNHQIEEKQKRIKKLTEQLSSLENEIVDITENSQYVEKLKEKQKLTQDIKLLKSDADQSIQSIQLEILELKNVRDGIQSELGKFPVYEQSLMRITELEEQEKTLASEFEKLEKQLYLIEQFIRTKVDLLEEKINSKFKFARFKLFDEQINGGLKEVCETTFKGVPYSSGLNNAAKINVGLDIINTLNIHYGVQAPIFVDNAEGVTQLIDTESQIISLIVSEQDKTLRVETKKEESVVA